MSNFRITYKPYFQAPEYVARIITAESVDAALEHIRKVEGRRPYSVRSITMQCEGHTAAGDPCQRFSAGPYCCAAHERRS